MNLRRIIPLIVVPALALAACGDDDDDADTTSAVTTGEAGDTPATTSDAGGATTVAATTADTTAGTAAGAATTSAGPEATVPVGPGGSIAVGSADFPESQLLAQIYGQALAGAGYDVSYELSIGSREIYYPAIESGEVDLLPEYTNALLSFVVRQDDPNAVPEATNVEEQIAALNETLPDTLQVLEPSTAEDKDVIVCTSEAAETHSLTNLTDLAGVLDQITLGAPPEFEGRAPFGVQGFMDVLGAPAPKEFVPLDVGAVADALIAGQIDCGNLFSTMSVITTEGFVALEDDQTLVPNEAVLPLIRTDAVDDTVVATLATVNSALDTDTLKELMVQIEVDAMAPDVVATEWLATL